MPVDVAAPKPVRILVFAKAPRPGFAKTRLAPVLRQLRRQPGPRFRVARRLGTAPMAVLNLGQRAVQGEEVQIGVEATPHGGLRVAHADR